MASVEDIGWGKYKSYEGPFYRGKYRYKLPDDPNESHRIMAVITATEGGRFDAWNGYDVCGWTSGLVQWCEGRGMYGTSRMLGAVAEEDIALLNPMRKQALSNGYHFQTDPRGRWRFHRDGNPVDTINGQLLLFFGEEGGTGKRGTWTTSMQVYAKSWAAAISSVWENKRAQENQVRYTARRLMGFALPYAKKILRSAPITPVGRAFTAAYLSFAANNPTWANRHLYRALRNMGPYEPWTTDWLVCILKELTFGPNVSIYPHRYKAIRPVLEELYGLDLPDMADELKQWEEDGEVVAYDTKEIQLALETLGHDLGPAGVDGKWGDKTTEAFFDFEKMHGVPKEHQDGRPDPTSLKRLTVVLEERGLQELL